MCTSERNFVRSVTGFERGNMTALIEKVSIGTWRAYGKVKWINVDSQVWRCPTKYAAWEPAANQVNPDSVVFSFTRIESTMMRVKTQRWWWLIFLAAWFHFCTYISPKEQLFCPYGNFT